MPPRTIKLISPKNPELPSKATTPDPTPNIIIGKHYTPKELSSLLGVTIQMLSYLRMKGRGPKFIKFGRRNIIYSAVEVEKYLKEQERLSTSDTGIKYTRIAPYKNHHIQL